MDYATAGENVEDSKGSTLNQQLLQHSCRGAIRKAHMENRKIFLQNAVKAKRQIHNEIGALICVLKEREIELCLEIDQECQDVDCNFLEVDGNYIPPPSETRISFRSDFPSIENELRDFGVLELINADVEKNVSHVQKNAFEEGLRLERDILQQLYDNLSCMELKLCTSRDITAVITKKFKKTDTIGFIEKEMRRIFNIAAEKETRMWLRCSPDAYLHLDKKESTAATLEKYELCSIIIEEMNNDGTWPKTFVSLKETQLQLHDKIQPLKHQASVSREAEIAKRLNDIIEHILPFLTREHQQHVVAVVERAKQGAPETEITKRLNDMIPQLLPFLSREHQQHVAAAVERAKQVAPEQLDTVPLPNVPLPISTLPSFNFEIKSNKSSSDNNKPGKDFIFSDPIEVLPKITFSPMLHSNALEQKNDVAEWIASSSQQPAQGEDSESEAFEVINLDPTLKLDEDDSIEVLSTDSTYSGSASSTDTTARKIGSFPRMLTDQFKKLKSRRKTSEKKGGVESSCSLPPLTDSQSEKDPLYVCDEAAKCPDLVAMEVDKPLPSSLLMSSFKPYLTKDNPDMWLSNKGCGDKSKWLSNKDTAALAGNFMDDIPNTKDSLDEWLPGKCLEKLACANNTNKLLDEWLCKSPDPTKCVCRDVPNAHASATDALNRLLAAQASDNPSVKEYPLSNLLNYSFQ